jgi:hypothetical protein
MILSVALYGRYDIGESQRGHEAANTEFEESKALEAVT